MRKTLTQAMAVVSTVRRCTLLLALLLVHCGAQLAPAQHALLQGGASSRSIFRPLFLDDIAEIVQGSPRAGRQRARRYNTQRIETERHDFTQSVETVGRGGAQCEFGYTYFYTDRDETIEQAHTAPETLIRLGLTENIEFRLRTNYVWESGEESQSGTEDLRWAFKLGISEYDEQIAWRPESALELRFTAPTAGEEFSTNRVEFGIDYIYGWPMGEWFELYGSTGYSTNGLAEFSLLGEPPSEDAFNLWSQSAAIGAELTESITFYSEFYGLFTSGRQENLEQVFYNIGVDYYVTDDFVLDVRTGLGLTGESDDFFVGIGGGLRL